MKLQRTTLILILLALGLGGFVYFYEIQGAAQREAAQAKQNKIFSFEEDQIQSLIVRSEETTLRFERADGKAADKSKLSRWQMKEPSDEPASDAVVSYLLDLLAKGKSDRTLSVPANQIQEYGLDKPLATVEVSLKNQQNYKLVLGKPNFNRSFYYAQTNPPAIAPQKLDVLLVPIDFENAVKRPLSEWKQVKEEVPDTSITSPSPTASPSPSPTPSGKATPGNSPPASPIPSPAKSDKVTPSKLDKASPTPSPAKSDKASPTPSPIKSDKAKPSKLDKASPTPSPAKSDKATPSKLDKASPTPSP
ncbi:DUF4340 domain-containing protein [Microcoleus sp. FACHB-831]|uniref:DUF4340 domain-containing protein n=1 Tax=Microcoleus sp. FACHB-831 TaxID=2692827 RepID=UPI0016881F6E|nr:DUF4340 domain-containing protein [Microcoleus sp. FACHB-831]MBD1924071.1 DUF4340 domain-containing protein [Microcoleus sp. FACHB-831]